MTPAAAARFPSLAVAGGRCSAAGPQFRQQGPQGSKGGVGAARQAAGAANTAQGQHGPSSLTKTAPPGQPWRSSSALQLPY